MQYVIILKSIDKSRIPPKIFILKNKHRIMDLLLPSRKLICTSFFVESPLIEDLLFSAGSTIYHLQSIFKFCEKSFSFVFSFLSLFICSVSYL